MSAKKPWLETWTTEGGWVRVGVDTYVAIGPGCEERALLAAAAPAMARALLLAEWGDVYGDRCPVCQGILPEFGHSRAHVHTRICPLDAALTAAGFPDQASRDAARADLVGRP